MCISFQCASTDLCSSLASVAQRIAASYVDPDSLSPLLACHLIALDKNPGIRPISIGEMSHCIISKPILFMVRTDISKSAGNLQLCAGQEAGYEAAVHGMQSLFHSSSTQAVLLKGCCLQYFQFFESTCFFTQYPFYLSPTCYYPY